MKKSASGSGRGRGWMKLNNKADPERPGGTLSNNLANYVNQLNLDEKNYDVPQFNKVLSIFEQIDSKDDGIMLNQKLKHLIKVWHDECKSASEIKESISYIYSKSLQDSSLATKVVIVMACFMSPPQIIHDVTIRQPFISQLQNNYDNRISFQQENPVAFRNFVHLLGGFSQRLSDYKRVQDSKPFTTVCRKATLDCLELLLKSAQPADLDVFTIMLYLNGPNFESLHTETLSSLLLQVRNLLVAGTNLTKTCRMWLLLAIDAANNRFGILPSDIHKYYEEQLGEKAMTHFQGNYKILKIETSYPSKTLDSYQSSVSVLQVTSPESTSPVEQTKVIYSNCQPQEGQRIGRPILGVGARNQTNGE